MAHRKPQPSGGATSPAASLSNVASQMLRSLGLDEVDPELVFELQKKEGAGAFGRVFRASYRSDPARLAALKVIPVALEAGQRGEDVESVRREIQFLRECDHPNVVAFYGAYYKDGALWVAMEYCGGGSVGDLRDTMSRRGTFVGTPYWMSPEMIQDSDYDYKSDIWSLGITAIELADQRPPLFDEHPMRVLIQIPRNPPPQLKAPGAWSPLFAQFLRFCLEKDPLERPTALECLDHAFVRAVDHWTRGLEGRSSKKRQPQPQALKHLPALLTLSQQLRHPSLGAVGDDDSEDIVEDIARLDDASDCESDESAASDDSSSSSGSSVEGDSSTSPHGESFQFQFRQPAAAATPPLAAATQPVSVAMISGDELLQLSVSESFELPVAPTNPTPAQPQPQNEGAPAPVAAVATAMKPSRSSSATELKLLPTRSPSPRTRNADRPATGDDANASSSPASERRSAPAPTDRTLDDSKAGGARSKAAPSFVTTTPKNLASVSASWQNPLSDIAAAASHPRVNVLLHSLHLSSSLSSTRLFTQLLQDEEQLRADAEHDTIDSNYATPVGTHGASDVSDSSKRASLRSGAVAAITSPSKPPTAQPRHAWLSLSGAGCATHSISSPFRVAHNVSVTFNSVDARFEGAPASAEWAALHRQFGIPLAEMRCSSDQRGVPALLHMLRRELLKRDGLGTKHIYRVSPERTEVQSVKAAINSGSVDHARVSDPHVYASLIKQWFRELPTSLLAPLALDDLSSVASASGAGGADVDAVLARLPPQTRAVFEWLLEHMLEVVDRSAVNKMTAQSVAVVMAPNLFSCESLSRTLSGSSHAAGRVADFLSALLEWKQAARRGSRRSSSVAGSVNRSLLFPVGSSPAGIPPATSSASPTQTGAVCIGARSVVETSKSPPDALDRATSALSGQSDRSSQRFHVLPDVDTPLNVALGQVIDSVWRELEAQGISSAEAMILGAKRELAACFERYQRTVLERVVSNSKRREERVWAVSALEQLATGTNLQTLVIPDSLARVQHWVAAALSADAFERLLRSERATKDKQERLRLRYPTGEGRTSSSTTALKPQTLDPDAMRDLFRQIAVSSNLVSREAEKDAKSGNQDERQPAEDGDVLRDGATQVAQLIADASKGNQSEVAAHAETIACCGEREPAIGNVLAGLGNASLAAHLEMEESQEQLLAAVESALRIRRLLQRSV
ncbi:hypothetical protein PybrP1_002759 [[Pythium] brassicae (nom. inval.)]|nr:hypothetical protein PybrP1_002759 [[Pythium] brassicae (nom. inval.)]